MRIGLKGPQEFLALVVRRKWWIAAPFLGLTCAFAVLIYFLPKSFVSETLILVRPRDVPADFVKDLIAGSAEQRLKSIEQTVLSRTNLIEILREFGDRLPEFSRLNMDEKVLMLRSQINIAFELEKASGISTLTYFRISYQNQNPDLAQKIASKLTALFIEQDNRVRETQVFGTTEFLSAELEKVSTQLNESEVRLKQVKTSRQFELPDQREANLRTLDRLGLDKKTNAEAVDRYATIALNLENQLSQTPAVLPLPVQAVPAAARNPQVEEYRKAQSEYEQAAAKYTAKHPEVLAAKAHLERLKQQVPPDALTALTADDAAGESAAGQARTIPNPLYESLSGQLRQVKTEFEIREKERTWIESEVSKYNRRVENTPQTEQAIAEELRQNNDLKKQYEDLKNKLSQARLSESLESKQKGSQFVIVDPANIPLTPAKPNKRVLLLGGTAISLLLAIVFAAGMDIARQRVWMQSEIETFWGVPVLIDIPEILTDSDLALLRKRRLMYAASSVAGVFAYGLCLYGVYLKHAFILRQLDPIIQKVVYR